MKSDQSALEQIMRRGRRVFGLGFVLYYGPAAHPLPPRIVVSQKVSKLATRRHLLKRRIRDIVRRSGRTNFGIVIITKKELADLPFTELASRIGSGLARISNHG